MDGAVRRGRAGFTLVEFILAAGLGATILMTLSYLLFALVRAQAVAAKSESVQMNLAAAVKTADHEISQASWLRSPARAGVSSAVLEGCSNASPPSTGVPAAPLDPSKPMRWFAFCPSDGVLFYHAGAGCPPSYACGDDPTSWFAAGKESQTDAVFTRAPLTTVVEVDVTMTNGESSGTLKTAAAFAGAAGSVQ
jgi:Tfp pilus assembly major pilin PilA